MVFSSERAARGPICFSTEHWLSPSPRLGKLRCRQKSSCQTWQYTKPFTESGSFMKHPAHCSSCVSTWGQPSCTQPRLTTDVDLRDRPKLSLGGIQGVHFHLQTGQKSPFTTLIPTLLLKQNPQDLYHPLEDTPETSLQPHDEQTAAVAAQQLQPLLTSSWDLNMQLCCPRGEMVHVKPRRHLVEQHLTDGAEMKARRLHTRGGHLVLGVFFN